MNISQEIIDLIGEDFNPFGWDARQRMRLEGGILLSCIKELGHALLAAKNEGLECEEMISLMDAKDLEFIYALNSEGEAIDEKDLDFASNANLGKEFNPFNWDARTRIPLAVGQLVTCIKSIIHIIIQGEGEGLTPQDLFEEINEDIAQVFGKAA